MSRTTHDRATHRETFDALLVLHGSEDVEEFVRSLWERLVDQESQTAHRFTIGAVVKRTTSGTFNLDSVIA